MRHGHLEEKMSDDEVIEISQEIDEAILNIADKHDMNFLNFAALILARMSRLSIDLDQKDMFVRLMQESSKLILNNTTQEANNIH
jgi:hypothetical protein